MSEQPKEYIITAEQLNSIRHFAMAHDAYNVRRILKAIRSRPHPAPAERKVCCASCPCREPNCEDDCPEWVANNALLTAQINDAVKAAARAARKKRDTELWVWCLQNGANQHCDLIGLPQDPFFPLKLIKKIAEMHQESLRGEQHE